MRRHFVLVGLLALMVPVAASAADPPQSTTLERVSAEVQPAIAYETITFSTRIYDNLTNRWLFNAQRISLTFNCTGFFVTPEGHVATAGHCVVWDADIRSRFLAEGIEWAMDNEFYGPDAVESRVAVVANDDWELRDREREIKVSYGVAASGIPQPQTRPALLLASRAFDRGDVAILKIIGEDLPALELAPESDVSVGTQAVAVGFPGTVDDITDANRFNPSFKDGSVSSEKTIGGGLIDVYEISAAVSQGMSGGPTVDSEGRVIGVNSFGHRDEPQAFNFIAPAKLVSDLMKAQGIENALGETNGHYVAGLDAYFAGERDQAIEEFDAVLAQNQSHELAQEYRQAAIELPEDGGFPLWLVALIVLAALALGGAGAYLYMQRRGQRAEPSTARPAPRATPASLPAGAQHSTVTEDGRPAVLVAGPRGETASRLPLQGSMVIGREAADIMLSDDQVSRRHALLRVVDERLELSDLNSANGTEVNGERISGTVTLAHGDTIRVGNTDLRIELPESMRGARPSGETVISPGS